MGDPQVGSQARLMSNALKRIAQSAAKFGTTVIFINQIRMKIGVVYGNPEARFLARPLARLRACLPARQKPACLPACLPVCRLRGRASCALACVVDALLDVHGARSSQPKGLSRVWYNKRQERRDRCFLLPPPYSRSTFGSAKQVPCRRRRVAWRLSTTRASA